MKSEDNCNQYDATHQENVIELKLQKAIENITMKLNYKTYTVETRKVHADGGNFFGILYEINVKGETIDNKEDMKNLFVKNIIFGDNLKSVSIEDIYAREFFFYTELSRIFAEMQNEANVPIKERYDIVKFDEESNFDMIILENLSKKGYQTLDRKEIASYQLAELSIRELAKLHALSFALKEKRPTYYEKKIRTMKEPFEFEEDWRLFVEKMTTITMHHLDGNIKNKLESFITVLLEKYPKYKNDDSLKICCLCHGDYRANNVLFKEHEGEISKVVVIDYQMIHHGNPVLDFLYFIFLGSDRKFRKKHMEDLKNIYFESLKNSLKYFDMDVNLIYPRKVFEKEYEEKLDFGLMVALQLLPIILVKSDALPDLNKDRTADLNIVPSECFKERIVQLVEDFIEWGYL